MKEVAAISRKLIDGKIDKSLHLIVVMCTNTKSSSDMANYGVFLQLATRRASCIIHMIAVDLEGFITKLKLITSELSKFLTAIQKDIPYNVVVPLNPTLQTENLSATAATSSIQCYHYPWCEAELKTKYEERQNILSVDISSCSSKVSLRSHVKIPNKETAGYLSDLEYAKSERADYQEFITSLRDTISEFISKVEKLR